MKKFNWYDGVALLAWLLPLVYLIIVYPTLPAQIPMHFGADGKPNGYGDSSQMLGLQIFLMLTSAGVYLLIKYLPTIDPKKQSAAGGNNYQKMALGFVIFLTAIMLIIIYTSINNGVEVDKLILPLVGLLFAFLGNVMYSIKPNYFAGIRTPWTLESEDTWRATHRLAGKLWVAGGLLLTVLTLLLSGTAAFVIFMSGVFVLALVPMVYSYRYFKSHEAKS
jgi:uncharacterized membrane protein